VQAKVVEPREAYLKAVDKASLLASFRSRQINTGFLTADPAVREPQTAG
jgi:hypothetical protein